MKTTKIITKIITLLILIFVGIFIDEGLGIHIQPMWKDAAHRIYLMVSGILIWEI
jgi:hypothetical protein